MSTIFDLLDTLNNSNNLFSSLLVDGGDVCKRQQQQHNPIKQTTSNSNKQQLEELKVISVIPEMEVTMYDDKLVIDVELAGVSKDNIEIDIKDSILTIQGEKKKNENTTAPTEGLVNNVVTPTGNDNDGPSIEEFEDTEKKEDKSKSNTTNTNSNGIITTTTTTTKPSPLTNSNKNNNNYNNIGKKYITERSFGHFKRFIDLSKIIYQLDLTEITTKFENGLLTIQINKKSNHKSNNTFKIEIN